MNGTRKLKEKKCRWCGDSFTPWNFLQVNCSPTCAIKYIQDRREKGLLRVERAATKLKRAETRKRKEKLKTRSDWLKLTQAPCNAYIRQRDILDGCISCNKPSTWGGQWHASHYRPSGNCSPLRFHPLNIHKSCSECNNFKSGNLSEFRISLIKKISLETVEWLESQNQPYQWDVDDLADIRKHYNEQFKLLKG